MHQTVGNVLRTLLHDQPPQHVTGVQAKDFIDKALSITMHAMHAGTHSTLGSSPGSLVFNRDVLKYPTDCWLACHHKTTRALNQWKSYEREQKTLQIWPCYWTTSVKKAVQTHQTWPSDKWSVQGSLNACRWYNYNWTKAWCHQED